MTTEGKVWLSIDEAIAAARDRQRTRQGDTEVLERAKLRPPENCSDGEPGSSSVEPIKPKKTRTRSLSKAFEQGEREWAAREEAIGKAEQRVKRVARSGY